MTDRVHIAPTTARSTARSTAPSTFHGSLRRRLACEQGAAMAIAIIVLMIVSTLAAAAVSVATQTNGSTRTDGNRKNALEAAEAGLQVALYRLNMLRPDDQHCVADQAALPDSTGTCESSTSTLGNGSTYSYAMTPTMGSSGSCVGLNIVSSTVIAQRCITATGTANGVSARSQIRAAAFGAIPLFPEPGITGINGITNGNNALIGGAEASNKTITGGNSNTTITGGVVLGPGGQYTGGGSPARYKLSSPIVLGPVDPGTSNQSSLSACPDRAQAGYPACNDDYRIANYIAHPTTPTPAGEDPSNGFSFNAATRTLATTANNGASITLTGGLYNFCEIDIGNNATISLATGVRAEIFIDSPDDPNSGCPAGSGSLNIKNNVTWNNPSNDPTALQIYVYGWNNGKNSVVTWNNGHFTGVLYAPLSSVDTSHDSKNSTFTGAISGSTVNTSNNFNFNWDSRAGTLQARSTGLYYRTAWAQCTHAPTTAGNPGSGCG